MLTTAVDCPSEGSTYLSWARDRWPGATRHACVDGGQATQDRADFLEARGASEGSQCPQTPPDSLRPHATFALVSGSTADFPGLGRTPFPCLGVKGSPLQIRPRAGARERAPGRARCVPDRTENHGDSRSLTGKAACPLTWGGTSSAAL
jgi:hypothetical protein